MISRLEFRSAKQPGLTEEEITRAPLGTVYERRREYLDIYVDGRPLAERLGAGWMPNLPCSQISQFDLDVPWERSPAKLFSKKLMTEVPGDLPSGRCALLVCPACGDLGCGAYAAFIRKREGSYVWVDFAWENTWEDPAVISTVGPFFFEAAPYDTAVKAALAASMRSALVLSQRSPQ